MTQTWIDRAVSADEAVSHVSSGMRAFIHGAAATPTPLIDALAKRDVDNVTTYHLHLDGPVAICDPALEGRFRTTSLFMGANMRGPVNEGRADFTPVFLSDIPLLFSSRRIPLDVALLQLSPPDKHGYCTLGGSARTSRRSCPTARRSRWASARFPTPSSPVSSTSKTSACTRRCSPIASSISSRPA